MDTKKESGTDTVRLFKASSTTVEEKKPGHIPPKQSADALFTFMNEQKYLEKSIINKKISARYCKEDIGYLQLEMKEIAFPMKCFCDINIHRLGDHLSWYGYYGIAFSKQWGMDRGIQPIQYINPDSDLCRDFRIAFRDAMKSNDEKYKNLRNFLALQLLYVKPYSGLFMNRNTGKEEVKCFTDECEWRFVPDVTSLNMEEIVTNSERMSEGTRTLMSNSLEGRNESSLSFEYDDIKYIILHDASAYHSFFSFIQNLDEITEVQKQRLISKILVWSEIEEDF